MSYAGITKGITAIGSAMMLAASRSGAAQGLRNELAESQPALTPWFERQIPGMYQKAYRWVAEMREIAEFVAEDKAAAAIYEGAAQFYERMAKDENGNKAEIGALGDFLARTPAPIPAKRLTYKEMIAAAEAEVETLSVADALALRGRADVLFVDLRDPRERDREGRIPGALHCTRGMLEFWIDPESPYHKPVFGEDKTFVFFCAAGWRSALAAQTAQKMGLAPVAHVGGGLAAWKEAGGPVEGPATAG
jgi:rhodanese-related sulfurtransferase